MQKNSRIFAAAVALAALVAGAGCSTTAGRRVVEGQAPGQATGAGATFTGPTNSGAASTQTAQRRVAYFPPFVPTYAGTAAPTAAPAAAAPDPAGPPAPPAAAASIPAPYLAPAWIDERTETNFGQHQDAAAIVKMAVAASGWGSVRWAGLVCLALCVGGLLWSSGNPEGYPLCFWMLGAAGVFLLIVPGNSILWVAVAFLPLGFYGAQKFGILRIPGLLP